MVATFDAEALRWELRKYDDDTPVFVGYGADRCAIAAIKKCEGGVTLVLARAPESK